MSVKKNLEQIQFYCGALKKIVQKVVAHVMSNGSV